MRLTDLIDLNEPSSEWGAVLPLDEEAEMQAHFGIVFESKFR